MVVNHRIPPRRGIDSFWELATDLFAICGADGMLYALNPAWERVLGWSREELTAQPLTAFIHRDDFEATVDVLARTHVVGGRIDELVNRWRPPRRQLLHARLERRLRRRHVVRGRA